MANTAAPAGDVCREKCSTKLQAIEGVRSPGQQEAFVGLLIAAQFGLAAGVADIRKLNSPA